MNRTTNRIALVLITFICYSLQAKAAVIEGTVVDKKNNEALIGATIQVLGTTKGTVTDFNGHYSLNVNPDIVTLEIKYIGYKDLQQEIKTTQKSRYDFALESDEQTLSEVMVVAKKNLEGENTLLLERKAASIAIENMGAKEMTIKGISTVQDGVKKITGISIADAGQLIVRGMGDRYSTTTLNGLPIASPNPDNKLIPLDLFPTTVVKNITVSKVYQAPAYADYSGAHVDISTKDNIGKDFFELTLGLGGQLNTVFGDFYEMERKTSLVKTPKINNDLKTFKTSSYFQQADKTPFPSSFDVSKNPSIPNVNGSIAGGKIWRIDENNKVDALVSYGVSYDSKSVKDAFTASLSSTDTLNYFNYDSYTVELKMAALASMGWTYKNNTHIGYTFFYARNAENKYQERKGFTYDYPSDRSNKLVTSTDIMHVYELMNHQLLGNHQFFDQKIDLDWGLSYGHTSSDEPDRRDLVFQEDKSGNLKLFTANQNATMRYFGSLTEEEYVADVKATYHFNEDNHIRFGGATKSKSRNYRSQRFYYNYAYSFRPTITSIYETENYLNWNNVQGGDITITQDIQPRNNYQAAHDLFAGFIDLDYNITPYFMINVGVRYENSKQSVDYYTDGGSPETSNLDTDDFFPAFNFKFKLNSQNNIRLSLSKTVTRPSFVEMAPFLYKPSFGADQIRGNADLKNGYNYNLDLRYDLYGNKQGDLFSITGYYKKLDEPIEQTERSMGGSAYFSFNNADAGMATGIEIEARKNIGDWKVGLNGSYMYTNVDLPKDGGNYTEQSRALQGASPYLANADITYSSIMEEDRSLNLSLLYNLQGPRIAAVGIEGLGDVKENMVHTLNFAGTYSFNNHISIKGQVNNLLNQAIVFTQAVYSTDNIKQEKTVKRFKEGTVASVSFTYKF
ncbi:MAG: TonB-dependent receptor [Bacteroidaceae bacterium]